VGVAANRAEYEAPDIDPGVDEALNEYIARRKVEPPAPITDRNERTPELAKMNAYRIGTKTHRTETNANGAETK
jgi:hypothetical protein